MVDQPLNPKTEAELAAEWKAYCMGLCRAKRDELLSATDYINFPDVVISDDFRAAMMAYRQALRDFPSEFSELFDSMTDDEKYSVTDLSMSWPEKPEA